MTATAKITCPEVSATPVHGDADGTLFGPEMAALLQHDAELRALQDPRLAQQPSWPWVNKPPPAGAWCSCCRGQCWWPPRLALLAVPPAAARRRHHGTTHRP
jgi:hypothetical protein